MELKVIGHIYTDISGKFGLPRQSGLVEGLIGRIALEGEYSVPEAVRDIEGYSHLWLIWGFSLGFSSGKASDFSPTVRPPRLGGNHRVGVFASRSPNRPNPLGLSLVKLESVEIMDGKVTLIVSGIDMADGTPVYDIKPYLPHIESIPSARGGFAANVSGVKLNVHCDEALLTSLPESKRNALLQLLAEDPRPSYQDDPLREYGFSYAGYEVRFTVDGDQLYVTAIEAV